MIDVSHLKNGVCKSEKIRARELFVLHANKPLASRQYRAHECAPELSRSRAERRLHARLRTQTGESAAHLNFRAYDAKLYSAPIEVSARSRRPSFDSAAIDAI